MFESMTEWVLARLRKRRGRPWSNLDAPFRISVDSSGITVRPEDAPDGETRLIRWREIHRIVVFKRDVYGHDMICMWIDSPSGQLELNETMPGWTELSSQLSRYLPAALPYDDWFVKVAFPAFEPSPTQVYVRE